MRDRNLPRFPVNGTGMITNGNPWQHPYAALARCPDGKIRRVRLNREADTFFSWPGRVSAYGKTMRGYVTKADNGETEFVPFTSKIRED
jgi:hypothetical protein